MTKDQSFFLSFFSEAKYCVQNHSRRNKVRIKQLKKKEKRNAYLNSFPQYLELAVYHDYLDKELRIKLGILSFGGR